MANHSDDTSLAWVWSQYRGEQVSGAKVEIIDVVEIGDVSTTAGRVPADESPADATSALPEPVLAPSSTADHASGATGPLLAALIATILGLLWFASADKNPEATVSKGATPAAPAGSPPAPAPPESDSGQTAAPAPAVAAPMANPTAPPPAGDQHPSRHRQRRHH
jgi:hypothetical protein